MVRLVLNTLLCLKILLILKVGHSRVKSSTYSIALVLDGQLNIVMMRYHIYRWILTVISTSNI